MSRARGLTFEEEQWLDIFAKYNDFFESLQSYYEENGHLTDNQYYYLVKEIDKAEADGSVVLNVKEVRTLKFLAENDVTLNEIKENYEKKGYLDKGTYEIFVNLKNEEENIKILNSIKIEEAKMSKESETLKINPENSIIKIPCPHCNFLCSSQVKFCKKCGEPLPKSKS